MKKAITLSCIDGIMRFFTLFLIIDLSVSVYTDSIFSIIAALLFIAVYYVISRFIAKKITSKKRPVFWISSLVAFILLLIIWGIAVKIGVAEIHILPREAWDTGAGWAAILLCTVLAIASVIERSILTLISVSGREKNDS